MNRLEAETTLARLQHGRPTSAGKAALTLDDLDSRLFEALMWCKRFSDLKHVRRCLRPARLAPHPLPASRWSAVDGVAAMRSKELERLGDITTVDILGRLLVWFPDETVHSATEIASEGFFDIHAAPPCATWISYFDEGDRNNDRSSYLLAWVPRPFEPFVAEGIRKNSAQCLAWLDDTNVSVRHIVGQLRSSKLIG